MKILLLPIILLCSFGISAQEIVSETVYRTTEVDAKPNLKDGMYTLTMFVSNNFKFPEIKNKKIKIFTSFIIEPDGTMQDEKAFYISAKDFLPSETELTLTDEQKLAETKMLDGMKAEAVRVLSLFAENWVPAQKGGKPVRCLYNYPLSFNIE